MLGTPSSTTRLSSRPAAHFFLKSDQISRNPDDSPGRISSIELLKALPGIGDAHSKKIVNGQPYDREDRLVSRKVVPRGTYEKIKAPPIAKRVAPRSKG